MTLAQFLTTYGAPKVQAPKVQAPKVQAPKVQGQKGLTLAQFLSADDSIEWVRWRMAIWPQDSGELEVETAGWEPMRVWGVAVQWSVKQKGLPEVTIELRDGSGSEAKAIDDSWRLLCQGSSSFSSFPVSVSSTGAWGASSFDWRVALSSIGYAQPEYAAILNGRSWPWSLGTPTQVLGQPKWTQWSSWMDAKRRKP